MHKARFDRPVTLPLTKLRLPLPGWVSLLHRISGVMLFLALPIVIYSLQQSLLGPEAFEGIRACILQPFGRAIVLLLVWALAHHLFAGVRHLLMDLHWGVGLASARSSALFVLASTAAVVLLVALRLFA